MRYKLSVFVALGAIILGLEYLFLEQPWESFILSTFWQRFFIAAILAGGAAIMAIAGILFFHETSSWQRLLGVVLAIVGLFLLRK